MKLIRGFLRPQWLLLLVVVVAFAGACFWILAPWQLGKNTRTSKQIDMIQHSSNRAPVPIDQLVNGTFNKDTEWRPVTVTGTFLPDKQSVVRLRSVEDNPAYEVLTPLAASDGHTYMINRGFVRPTEGTALPAITPPPTGEVSIVGRLRQPEGTAPGRGPRTESGVLQVYSIDPPRIGETVGLTIPNFYVEEVADQPGALGELPLPQIDSGPYLSYGLQWIAFGIMAPLGLGYFIWSEVRHRRRQAATGTSEPREPLRAKAKQARATLTAESTEGLGGSESIARIGDGADTTGSTKNAQRKLADRYGR